jgi:hypothetical protein
MRRFISFSTHQVASDKTPESDGAKTKSQQVKGRMGSGAESLSAMMTVLPMPRQEGTELLLPSPCSELLGDAHAE